MVASQQIATKTKTTHCLLSRNNGKCSFECGIADRGYKETKGSESFPTCPTYKIWLLPIILALLGIWNLRLGCREPVHSYWNKCSLSFIYSVICLSSYFSHICRQLFEVFTFLCWQVIKPVCVNIYNRESWKDIVWYTNLQVKETKIIFILYYYL